MLAQAVRRLLAVLGPSPGGGERIPRTLLVVAHPDDETVGAGSRLPRLAQALFVHVTDGAPRDGADAARHGLGVEAYAQARRRELEAALRLCGIAPAQARCLGVPDQQAVLHLVELASALASLMAREEIEVVLTQPYEGGHPDHDATAFAVHAGAALLRNAGRRAPAILEMASYHAYEGRLRSGAFLPDAAADQVALEVRLGEVEQLFKRSLLACFATQRDTLRALWTGKECFRPAPAYDFLRPPHAGALFYEGQPWGATGADFRVAAAAAQAGLGLEAP
jgi:LmbE family N-acetylglucosaminyl deacetylase